MVVRELKRKIVYIMGLVSLGALFLAYQVRVPLQLDLGARGDQAHVSDFYDQEFADGLSYRWSSGRSIILFRGVATWTPAQLTLRLNGSRPGELPSPHVVILGNGREVGPLQTKHQFETYRLRLAPDIVGVSGDLAIEIHCDAFVPAEVSGAGDRRQLGVMVDSIAVEPTPGRIPVVLPPLRQILCLVLIIIAAYLWVRQLAVPTRRSLLIAGLLLAAMSALVIRWPLQLGLYDRWLATLLAAVNVVTIVCRSAWSRLTGDRSVPAEALLDLHLLLVFAVAIAAGLYVGKGIWQPLREDRATDFFINYTAANVLGQGGNIYDVAALGETSRTVDPDLVGWDFSGLFRMYITPPVNAILLLPLVPLGYERARTAFLLLGNLLLLSSLAIILKARRADRLPRSQYLLTLVLLFTLDPIYVGL